MYSFCTYFDSRYLSRGLVLYQSLQQHCPSFRLWVLCLDPHTYVALRERALPNLELISMLELEQADPALLHAKSNRSLIEYYFTCTPVLPLFILKHYLAVDLITYLDADLFFFASPEQLFAKIAESSIAMCSHRFPARLQHLDENGTYNVGWLTFRSDTQGISCLERWREQCLEWCYDRVEPGRFADQKYLDDWPDRFGNVRILEHKGANLAPWNLDNYVIRSEGGTVWVDDVPLIFYHFQGLTRVLNWWFDSDSANYGTRLSSTVRRQIYGPYLRALEQALAPGEWPNRPRGELPETSPAVLRTLKSGYRLFRGLFSDQYLFFIHHQVI